MPINAGYTLKCKSCGSSWSFTQDGFLVDRINGKKIKENFTPDQMLAWHADFCKPTNEIGDLPQFDTIDFLTAEESKARRTE